MVLDPGGPGVLCRSAQYDRGLVPGHLQENKRGGTCCCAVSYVTAEVTQVGDKKPVSGKGGKSQFHL